MDYGLLVTVKRKGDNFKMRIVLTWVFGVFIMATITMGWYITLPILLSVSRFTASMVTDANVVAHINFVEIIGYVWGPIFDLGILLYLILFATKRDVQSEYATF